MLLWNWTACNNYFAVAILSCIMLLLSSKLFWHKIHKPSLRCDSWLCTGSAWWFLDILLALHIFYFVSWSSWGDVHQHALCVCNKHVTLCELHHRTYGMSLKNENISFKKNIVPHLLFMIIFAYDNGQKVLQQKYSAKSTFFTKEWRNRNWFSAFFIKQMFYVKLLCKS